MVINSVGSAAAVLSLPRGLKSPVRVTRAEEKMDYVALSSRAKDYQAVKNAMSKTPDIREEKVREIKNKLESGDYNVSSSDLADKMISKFFE
jgi:negative regulator of flagellin synthesis FlgM